MPRNYYACAGSYISFCSRGRLTFLSIELSYFLLRLDCVHFLQREKIRTVSGKIKFLFSARGVRLVFWDEQAAADRAISSTFATANPSRGGRGAHSIQLRAGACAPQNQIVSIRGNKEVDRAVPCAMLNISGIAA